jgi:hypothetical protein
MKQTQSLKSKRSRVKLFRKERVGFALGDACFLLSTRNLK